MHLFKNKKVVIACIALLVMVLIIIGVIAFKKPKQNGNGDMSLADTIGKGNGHSLEVYINRDKSIVLEVEDSLYANFAVGELALPARDVVIEKMLDSGKMSYTILIDTKPGEEEKSDVTYPCSGEIILTSERFGIEYKVKYSVDTDIAYKGGTVATKEIDKASIVGYVDYTEKHGELNLPKNAVLMGVEERKKDFSSEKQEAKIDVSIISFLLDGQYREIVVTSADNQKIIDAYYANANFQNINVSGIEARVFLEQEIYTAIYNIGDYIYINQGFCVEAKDIKEKKLVEALEPFISK